MIYFSGFWSFLCCRVWIYFNWAWDLKSYSTLSQCYIEVTNPVKLPFLKKKKKKSSTKQNKKPQNPQSQPPNNFTLSVQVRSKYLRLTSAPATMSSEMKQNSFLVRLCDFPFPNMVESGFIVSFNQIFVLFIILYHKLKPSELVCTNEMEPSATCRMMSMTRYGHFCPEVE